MISRTRGYGFLTRCVTNGYWATSLENAQKKIEGLVNSGLNEINLSTGDDHAKYVLVKIIINAATAAAEKGINIIITAAIYSKSQFNIEEILNNNLIKKYSKKGFIKVQRHVWIETNGITKRPYDSC